MAVTSCGGAIYSPNLNENGADTFIYEASDGTLTSLPAIGSVTINPVNDPPVCPDGAPVTVAEDSASNTIALPPCSDPVENNLPITCSLDGAPANGSATVSSACTASYTPAPNFCGNDSFAYSGADSGAPPASDSGVISIIVTCDMDSDDDGVLDADEANCDGNRNEQWPASGEGRRPVRRRR